MQHIYTKKVAKFNEIATFTFISERAGYLLKNTLPSAHRQGKNFYPNDANS